jgi:hypothetical protein
VDRQARGRSWDYTTAVKTILTTPPEELLPEPFCGLHRPLTPAQIALLKASAADEDTWGDYGDPTAETVKELLQLGLIEPAVHRAREQGPGGEWTDIWEFRPTAAGRVALEGADDVRELRQARAVDYFQRKDRR